MFSLPPDFAKTLEHFDGVLIRNVFACSGDFAGTCAGVINILMRCSFTTFSASVKNVYYAMQNLVVFFCNLNMVSLRKVKCI